MITFCGSRPDSMYGLWKTYIPIEGRNNVPIIHINFFVSLLKEYAVNKYNVRDLL